MDSEQGHSNDLAAMVVPQAGRLVATEEAWEPYQLLDPTGTPVRAVSDWFHDLQAAGRSPATLRSYGLDLLRWFRFLWAADVGWERATRIEARDFCRWLLVAGKPTRPHWRTQHRLAGSTPLPPTGERYAASVRAHSETVLRSFYDFHRDAGSGPILNLFARLGSHRDRALVAFYVSTGARASELLSALQGGVDPGRQVITVTRKGTRHVQELPASTDAFVWLRLYQLELEDAIPRGRRQPLWWTLRRPHRPLTYHAAHRMFERVNQRAGSKATLHSLRHTAAYRMAED